MRSDRRFRSALWGLILAAAVPAAQAGSLAAQATSNVPLDDPAYVDLDALVSAGLTAPVHVGQRPWSRLTFARLAASVPEEAVLSPRQGEALARLRERFGSEGEGAVAAPGVRFREVRADATWADSPWREIPSRVAGGQQIDGSVNPLLQGQEGRPLVDGWTLGVEPSVEARPAPGLVVVARPRLQYAGPRGADEDGDVGVHTLYARGAVGNVAFQVGRDHLFWGQGAAAGLMVSDNARGLDMIRVGNERPFRLPWLFRYLGPTRLTQVIADMGADRDIPHSKVFLTKASFLPHPDLEVGIGLLNQQLGEGAPEAPFWERVADLTWVLDLFMTSGDFEISDKLVVADVRWRVAPGFALYGEAGFTDIDFRRIGDFGTHDAAYLAGVDLSGLGSEGRWSGAFEVHYTGIIYANHGQFTTGHTLDRVLMGDPLGPAGRAVRARVNRDDPDRRIGMHVSRESRSTDTWSKDADFHWVRRVDAPEEVRKRFVLGWEERPGSRNLALSAVLGVERASHFAFTDQTRTNFFGQLVLTRRWR
ncbi:MAG: capsule assembly Wzi family protein [Gemmatimonadota bacterium]|nr:capsule assembly Wzi family protein [Gemmatimonadota bacterium]